MNISCEGSLNNIHDACILINSFFDSVAHILQNIFYIEMIFFKNLYGSEEGLLSNSKSLFQRAELIQLKIECNGGPFSQLKNHISQEGENFIFNYYSFDDSGVKQIHFTKSCKYLKCCLKDRQMEVALYVKEKSVPCGNSLDSKEEFGSQYELSFIVKELESSVLIYFKIELHPIHIIVSPFNKEFRNKLQSSINCTAQLPEFRSSYENTESIVINSNREIVFSIVSNPKTYDGNEAILEVQNDKGHLKIGDRFNASVKLMDAKLEFEVIKHCFELDSEQDSVFSCKLISSVPEQIKFSITFTIKSISPLCQLLLFESKYDDAFPPDFMKKHSVTKRATLKSFKSYAELISGK